jgi:hypothetical protein
MFTSTTAKAAGKKSGKARKKKKVRKLARPGPALPASHAERQSILDAAAWWVFANDTDAKPPDALHKNMQMMLKRGDTSYVRALITPAAAKGSEFEQYDGNESDFLATVDKLLADIRKPNNGFAPPSDGLKVSGNALSGSAQG